MLTLACKNRKFNGELTLTRSKSESNRALLIRALYDRNMVIEDIADADDTKLLQHALDIFENESSIDVGHAGTSYRFLTAFLAVQERGEWILTGSERMKERPIAVLVEALIALGANIQYLEREGYPPLKIVGNKDLKNVVEIDGGISSQYISSLLLIGAKIKGGLTIQLKGKLTSIPYLKMTITMMQNMGLTVVADWEKQLIQVEQFKKLSKRNIKIEGDWSAASYWYSLVSLSDIGSSVHIAGLNEQSMQGDAVLKDIYAQIGVRSTYSNEGWLIEKIGPPTVQIVKCDLSDAPDIAQTIACSCAGLGLGADLTGLHTLRIKETDRLTALKVELSKFNISVNIIGDEQLTILSGQGVKKPQCAIATYKDHRMAMSFAPLSMLVELQIENEEVVSKSYPEFWKDLSTYINVGS